MALALAAASAGCVEPPVGATLTHKPTEPEAPVTGGELVPVPDPYQDTAPQPPRDHPYAVAMSADGATALVTLRGNELVPGRELVVVDVAAATVRGRVTVGPRPVTVRIHPDGDLAIVLSQLSRVATVHDVATGTVQGTVEVGYYAQDLRFDAAGARAFVTNHATDELQELHLAREGGTLVASPGVAVEGGDNPGAIALSPDGSKIYVADTGGMGLRVYDSDSLHQLGFIAMGAPVFDVASAGEWIVAATLNDTNGLPCEDDSDFPGEQGDGIFEQITDRTCSRGFADLQNEIAFIDPAADSVAVRYTSDTAAVSEADREGDHPPESMKVAGALPFAIAVASAERAYVTMGASFEVVEMEIGSNAEDGLPLLEMPRSWATGFAPRGVAVDAAGHKLVVANSLGETLSIIPIDGGERVDVVVGQVEPPFPATDAEVGELFFFASHFSSDGDQSCSHCHPDGGSDGKAWGVSVVRAFGRRATLPARDLRQTKPLLVEGVFDENDFGLEMEAMAFRPDFHDSSYSLQVKRRDEFFREVSTKLFGIETGYSAMVKRVGAFLMVEPRLLPSPFAKDTPSVERGRELFFRFDVGCALCHPSPAFASPLSFEGTITMARFDRTNEIDPDVSLKYLENARDGFFNANTLRGLWDRRGVFFHDGRARHLRETVLTPGHECLEPGERGFNELDGAGDSHGGISTLSCTEVADLTAFLFTLD